MEKQEKIDAAVIHLKKQISRIPETGIILGSGLGLLVDEINNPVVIPYHEIPFFPTSTVAGHKGELIFGKLSGKAIMVMNGRFHYYEGYEMEEVIFPLRVFNKLGGTRLLVTNAAGGLNPDFNAGDLMLIEDIINLYPANPLRGYNDETLGPRFPDMSEPFDPLWTEKSIQKAKALGLDLKQGVYVGLTGPSLETKAEVHYLRCIGGDAVGMSTVPEVIAAQHMRMKTLAFSVITNESIPKVKKEFTHEDVVQVANQAGKKLMSLIKEIL